MSTKLTPSGVPGFSGSTGRGAAGADCAHSGRASPRTFSSDRTRVDRLNDFRSSRREKGKREYPGISSCWTVPLNSYSLCLNTLQAGVIRLPLKRLPFKMKAASHLRDVERMRSSFSPPARLLLFACVVLLCFLFVSTTAVAAEQSPPSLELSRPVRSWEFLPVVGMRAGLFGNESGEMEAWVYPLKILRGFRLTFHVDGRALPAESLARTLIVHPESATLVYAGDNFSVRETFFVPVQDRKSVVLLDVETEQPLEIEAGLVVSL